MERLGARNANDRGTIASHVMYTKPAACKSHRGSRSVVDCLTKQPWDG